MTTIGIASRPLSESDHSAHCVAPLSPARWARPSNGTISCSTARRPPSSSVSSSFRISDPLVGVLEAFAVYSVGFIARPIGAMIFGHYGDRIGRKRALVATLLLTGLATFAVGFVPTYDQVGIWGAVHPDHHPLHPGSGRRRRMGRLGTVVDGMGGDERSSWFHHVVSTAWRSGRGAAGEHRGAGV